MITPPRVIRIVALSLAGLLVAASPAFAGVAGSPDQTFGSAGFTVTSFDTQVEKTYAGGRDQAIQSDGMIVVAGSVSPAQPSPVYDLVVLRYQTNGILDPAFGADGVDRMSFGGSAYIGGVAIDAKGRILVDGMVNGNGFVVRLTSSGAPDAGFGTDGVVELSPPGHGSSEIRDLLVVNGNEPLVVGASTSVGSDQDLMLVRLRPGGRPDGTFGAGGYVFVHRAGVILTAFSAATDPLGNIITAGWYWPSGGNPAAVALRFSPLGAPDTSFSGDGMRLFRTGGSTSTVEPTAISVRASGFVVLSGIHLSDGGTVFGLTAFDLNGHLDTTFSGDGKRVYDPTNAADTPFDLAQGSDGSFVMVGGAQDWELLVRVSGSGVPDPGFGTNGVVQLVPNASASAFTAAVAVSIQTDGDIVTSGGAANAIFVGRAYG
jgi:uncharacterized delta-60 repeat protein